jgi:hypothetical protein
MPSRALVAAALLLAAQQAAGAQPREAYFPHALQTESLVCGGTFPVLTGLEVSWYSKHLAAAAEASLYKASLDPANAATKTYRFTWLRSFHEPVVIRINEAPKGEMRLTAKRLTGQGGTEPGHVGVTVARTLSVQESGKLRALIARDDLANLEPADCAMGADGAQWILESRTGGAYHFAHRWSPKNGPVREIGLYLLTLTGWRIGDIY